MNRRDFLKGLVVAACVGAVDPLDALASWWGESLTLVDIVFDDGWQKAVSIRGSPSLIDNLSLDVTVQFDREKLLQHTIVLDDTGGEWRVIGDFEGLRGPKGRLFCDRPTQQSTQGIAVCRRARNI